MSVGHVRVIGSNFEPRWQEFQTCIWSACNACVIYYTKSFTWQMDLASFSSKITMVQWELRGALSLDLSSEFSSLKKTCSYMYTTSALHNLKVSRAEISTVFFYEEIYFGTLIEQSVCEKNLYEICSTFFECSLVFSTFHCTCMMFSPLFLFVNYKIFFRKEESDIFSYRGFLVPNVMKNEVER